METPKHQKNQFPALEEKVLAFWEASKIFEQSLAKPAPEGTFVFFEGPPTANGQPGLHHVLARAFKDVMPRYKTMRGYHVERKAGWDTHGLPVELAVEKELGLSGKPDIEKYGVKEFNQKCRDSVWRYKDEWEKLTRRIGFWLDLEHPYITYDNDYIESVWAIIKRVYDQGLLSEGYKVVPHCPRCGTSLSSHEVAQGYREIKDKTVYVKFKLKPDQKIGDTLIAEDNTYVLVWTTTPWTLPGNVALAVNPNIDYVLLTCRSGVGSNQDRFILAKDRVAHVFPDNDCDIIKELSGQELLGLEYQPLFDIAAVKQGGQRAHYLVAGDFVTTADGTGVVHIAPMYGEDDYQLGLVNNLPLAHTVNEDGTFNRELAAYGFVGRFVKDEKTEQDLIEFLERNDYLQKIQDYSHDYPFCWRCETPLLYFAKNSWFIKMTAVKDKLLANASAINWLPEHIKEGRFGEWLNNVKDWAVSRERYWGTPLPIWRCERCGAQKCVGSKQELGQTLEDLHRPFIDEITFECACGGQMKRDRAVTDCWLDSGSMPFAQYHYPFANEKLIDGREQYPAAFIAEAIDQTRGWFYTLLAVSTLLDKGACYQNVICLGHINDQYGKKMSKSKGNIVAPNAVIDEFGADAARLHLYTINQPGEGKKYDTRDTRDVLRQNNMTLWNVLTFYQLYAADNQGSVASSDHVLDRWILSRLSELASEVTAQLNAYHIYEAARTLPIFISDLSTWYLRRSRDRLKSGPNQAAALATLKIVLETLARLMAPFTPFLAESVWQAVTGHNFQDATQSAHLESWPKAGTVEERILADMAVVRRVVEMVLAKRDEAGIKVRQPLPRLTIANCALSDEYLDLIKAEVNVKEIACRFGQDELAVTLDTAVSAELAAEGLKRDLTRAINGLRKQAGLTRDDRVKIFISGHLSETLKAAAALYRLDILGETLADQLSLEEWPDDLLIKDKLALDGQAIDLGLKK